ncbi:carbohydrate ABC transporter permease [Paenibacillus eucommiae]|uniref:Aldouronate transport system permease protein n=1 Tax=Paenibacillus eucommiae TaxID=1355755 RepID=A0ABS4J8W4_9BACL|nr:carbohydrate ABC transporter permease [Paenibacillus eucommiae]MBP1996297.1 putative aldouronate transport system permease protein [Paenibacillus eucommiae]
MKKRISPLGLINAFILLVLGAITLYPFYNVYVYTFNEGMDSLRAVLYFWPRKFTLDNITKALMQDGIMSAFQISLLRTIVGTLLTLICTSSLAYAMTKRNIKGYRVFSTYFFITFIFTGGLIPFYMTMLKLHLYDTFWVLVLPGIYSFWYMVIFRTFFDSIPKALGEAAEIEGASFMHIFIRVMVPLSKPVYATIGLFAAVNYWNDWFTGLFFVKKQYLLPLQSLLQKVMNETDMISKFGLMLGTNKAAQTVTPYSIKLAIVVISVTPIVAVYPFLQKYFVKGMMLGSIKG